MKANRRIREGKKVGIFVLLCALCLCLAACGGKTAAEPEATGPDYLVLVNKENPIDANYINTIELVDVETVYDESCQMEKATFAAYEALHDALLKQGVEIGVDSSYRSVEKQQEIMDRFTEEYGEEYAKNTVAEPGTSEHHTGLAVDIVPKVDGEWVVENEDMMQETEIFSVIHTALPDYGFIVRYPQGKDGITGYSYEPWHLRYVGKEAAKEIAEQGITLEEYVGNGVQDTLAAVSAPKNQYVLKNAVEVAGRQGIAVSEDAYIVSGSTTLTKYDKDWNVIAENTDPFSKGYTAQVNHIGDIDVYNNEIYCGVEWFLDGKSSNIQIAVYDADTLQLKRTFPFSEESGQNECSGIAVNPDDNTVWLCSWAEGESGRYLYHYDNETGAYLGKVHMHAVPQWIQGVACYDGSLYVTADDGDADFDEPDHIYRLDIEEGKTDVKAVEERVVNDVTKQGEIEGLSFDREKKELLLIYNRGARIVLGMPSGFYEGYDREIHEAYTYSMK